MKKAVKAALWSAFAYPGVGHYIVRSYARAWLLVGVFTGLMWYLVNDILSRGLVDKVNGVVDKAVSGEIALDLTAMLETLDRSLGPDPIGVKIASWAALICWIAGIVDAYLIGRWQEEEGAKPDNSPQTRSEQSKTE